jgi:hypothetical protein
MEFSTWVRIIPLIPSNQLILMLLVLATVDQTRGTANESHFLNELRSFLKKMTQGGHPEGTMPTYSAASPADSAAPDAKKANTPEKAKQDGANITQTGATFQGSVSNSDINANQFATTGNQTNYAPPQKRGEKK